jgi:hypothetical protein
MGSLNVATVVMGSEGANTGRNPNPFYGDIIGCAKNKNTETTSITNCLAIADRYGLSGNGDAFVAQNWYVTFTNNVDGKKDAAWLADPENAAYVNDWEYNAVLGYVVPKTISEMFPDLYIQEGIGDNAGKLRFVGVLADDIENINSLEIKIEMTYKGVTYAKTCNINTVYESVMAAGEPVSAQSLGGAYLYAVEITGLEDADSDVTFTVTSIVDGMEVSSETFTYSNS